MQDPSLFYRQVGQVRKPRVDRQGKVTDNGVSDPGMVFPCEALMSRLFRLKRVVDFRQRNFHSLKGRASASAGSSWPSSPQPS